VSIVQEIESAIEKLPAAEQRELARWLGEHLLAEEETPEMLAAIDEGLRSLKEKGARLVTREELQEKIRQWSGVSR
jgi:peptidoglycan/xylan/chitin deacetylase (PgdA/CDA1 family)